MRKRFIIVLLSGFLWAACTSDSEPIVNNPEIENRKAVGASAKDLLAGDIYKKTIIELAYVEGFEPTAKAINSLKNFIEERTFKPNGVEVKKNVIPSTDKNVYTINDIVALENQYRSHYNTENTIAVWGLFVNGKSSKDDISSSTLGLAYYNTSFVVFEETIRELSNTVFKAERSLLESSVINHEFGHILGLTNSGTPLQSNHEDSQHPKHCNQEDCLMYWATETSEGIKKMFYNGEVPKLGSHCIADLRANGGK